jgi:hypothetical protein
MFLLLRHHEVYIKKERREMRSKGVGVKTKTLKKI